MMRLLLHKEIEVRIPRGKIETLFVMILKKEKLSAYKGEVNLIFSNDERLLSLNKKFRKKSSTTDVLSFNIDEPDSHESVFGEIYISIPQAKRQAISYQAPLNEELLRLSCHGLLHLIGYDHIDKNDAIRMKAKENIYLGAI